MGKGLDRTEILRRDCRKCGGNGYTGIDPNEMPCDMCDGSGQEEKEVPFKFDGPRTSQEIREIWES